MLNSTVLDVAVGLVFTFLALSLAVSAIVEAIASAMRWRATTLLQGISALLNDPEVKGLALNIYNQSLVNPRSTGRASTARELTDLPSYVEPQQFADALIDITKLAKSAANIDGTIDANVTDPQLNRLMKGIADRTAGDLGRMRDEFAKWFDNSMDRVSGVYKRRTQLWSFVLAILLAGVLNVSSIAIGQALWRQPMLARTIKPTENLKPSEALKQLEELDLPIGWSAAKIDKLGMWSVGEMLMGWLITALATLFGAPFWFDSLQQIVRLRGSGPSPAEKSSGSAAAK